MKIAILKVLASLASKVFGWVPKILDQVLPSPRTEIKASVALAS
jgi:hypothetical protein